MPIALVGTLPVAALNVGLAAAPAGIQAEIAKLTAQISGLAGAIAAQLQVTANFPPNLTGYATAFATLDASALLAAFNPANWVTLNAGANVELVAELGLIEAQLAVVGALVAPFEAGLAAPGIAGYSYAGRAAGFGHALAAATAGGIGSIPPTQNVNALIIGCADFDAWGAFSAGFNTGPSAQIDLGSIATPDSLRFLGSLGGGQWNTGLRDVFGVLASFLLELEGAKAALEAQIELSVGVNLPDPGVVINADIDVGAALENLVGVQADITADITLLQARIDFLLDLVASITLSGGGLTLWSYSGPAGALGSSFAPLVANGLPGVGGPNTPAYGVALACADAAAWANFGLIFKTS